jgi:pimeloyl-ACP methyl ester carboxylesterase
MRTWGRPELKAPEKFTAIAHELAPSVPERVRELFLVGIGALPGAWDLASVALEKYDARPLDPAPYLAQLTGRVDLVHGADDDVIPYTQSLALAHQLAHADVRIHITGMYGHTGAQRPPLSAAVKELVTMVRALRAMS